MSKHGTPHRLAAALLLGLAGLPFSTGIAQPPAIRAVLTPHVRPGAPIRLLVGGLLPAMKAGMKLDTLRLYLDGYPLSDVRPSMVSANRDTIEFRLERTDSSRATWHKLYARYGARTADVAINIGGRTAQFALDFDLRGVPPKLQIEFATGGAVVLSLVLALALFFALLWADLRWGILRERPREPDAAQLVSPTSATSVVAQLPRTRYPYSLGALQMAFWLVIVAASFIAIAIITRRHDGIVNAQALVLLGIGTGAALGSFAIRDAKRAVAAERVEAHAAERHAISTTSSATFTRAIEQSWGAEERKLGKSVPEAGSSHLLSDVLLTDDGLALHRVQVLTFTLILGTFFVHSVVTRLAFPEFDAMLLALMGISGGTYLGFKIPELNR